MPHSSSKPATAPPRARSATDLAWTAGLSVLLLGVCWVGLAFSWLATLATDGCSDTCGPRVNLAYLFGWGGIVLALLVTLVGVVVAAIRRRPMWIWPVVGGVIFTVSYAAFLAILQWATGAVF